jgi:AcrR family transcriptional regulator
MWLTYLKTIDPGIAFKCAEHITETILQRCLMKPLVKKPRTKRGIDTLNRILSAAAQVFYQKGYGAANVNDIAKLAGVAIGTFYIYFDGKYNLYKFLLLQCSHQIRKHLSLSTKQCATRREAERMGLKCWLEYTVKNPYIYNLIWESLYVDRKLFIDYYDIFCRSYLRGIKTAQDKGEVLAIDGEVLAYVLMGATTFLGLNWGVFKEESDDLDTVVDEFMKLLDHGMFAAGIPQALAPPQPLELHPAPEILFNVEVDEDFIDHLE